MTVSSSTNKVSYSGNGTLTTFAYSFKIFDQDDLTVILRAADGTETTQTITTHYTVTGVGSASGGNVVFGTAPASGVTVVIIREQPLTQGLDLVPNDPFPAQSLEESLDKLTFMAQKHEEELSRAIKGSRTNVISNSEFTISATDRANKVFSFDASGNLSVTQELGTFKGNWATSTTYVARDIVKDTSTNNIFIVNADHTSSGAQPLTTNANSAKYDLIVDAASATTSASAAATSATAAASSATAAAASETASAASEAAAATSETNSANSATASAASATSAAASYDSFDDRYLGAKSTSGGNPTVDNDGDALVDGALFFDTTNNVMMVYNLGTTTWLRTTPTSSDQTKINTVNSNISNVNTVAGISSNVTTVAGISANVTTVAGQTTNLQNVTDNLSAIQNAGTNATNAASSATAAASSATAAAASQTAAAASAASAATSYDSFDDRYLGVKSSDPTTDNDGDALASGMLYFSSSENIMKVYDGASWIAATSAGNVSLTTFQYTATGGQTTFSGSDDNSATLSYTVNNILVTLNGSLLFNGTDYTATNGTSVVLTSGAVASDVLQVTAFKSFTTADMVPASTGGTFAGNVAVTGDLTVDTSTLKVDSSNNRVGIGTTLPSRQLHLSGSTPIIRLTDTDTNAYGEISSSSSDGNLMFFADQGNTQANTTIRFYVDTTERMRIDSSGHVLVGKTAHNATDVGIVLNSTGRVWATASGDSSIFNRTTSDGAIIDLRKDGSTVGSIDVDNGDNLTIQGKSDHSGLQFGTNAIFPHKNSANIDDTISLGESTLRFEHLFLSGNVNANALVHDGDDNTFIHFPSADTLAVNTGGSERMRIDSSGNVGIGTSSPNNYSANHKSITLNAPTTPLVDLEVNGTRTGSFVANSTNVDLNAVTSVPIRFLTADTERLRITSSGTILHGKTTDTQNDAGHVMFTNGAAYATRSDGFTYLFNRLSSNGELLRFQKANTTVGGIGFQANGIYINSGNVGLTFYPPADSIFPTDSSGNNRDNATDLGTSTVRFDDIYATNGTIQTSDRNEKQDIEELTDAEQRVAVAAKGLLRKFRWKDKVAEKGDEARTHFGIIAQDLQAAFAAEGLDASDYAMFISSTWTDEETGEERTRMGVRYSELLAFIIAAI